MKNKSPEKALEHFWFEANEVQQIKPTKYKKLLVVLLLVLLTTFTVSCYAPAPTIAKTLDAKTLDAKTLDIKTYNCVKEALYYEARGEPEQGMKAVLSVIHNRTKHQDFPSSYCSVIKQPMQFSYRNNTSYHKQLKIAYTASEQQVSMVASDLAYRAATGAFKPSMIPSVLYYHSTEIKPKWSKNMKTYATIGHHKFLGE